MHIRHILQSVCSALLLALPLGCGQPAGSSSNQPVVVTPPASPPTGSTEVHVNRNGPGGGLHVDVKKPDGSEPVDINLPPRNGPAVEVNP